VGLKRRDEEFMKTLDQMQQMVELMANAVKRLRNQAEKRLAESAERERQDAEAAADESPLVH
jgi:prefoldin subunit 5